MTVAKGILASVCILMFLGPFLVFSSIKFQILDVTFVKTALHKSDVYSHVPALLTHVIEEQEVAEGDEPLTPEELAIYKTLATAITPQLARELTERNIEQVLTFVHGKSERISWYLPLSKLGLPVDPILAHTVKASFMPPTQSEKQLEGLRHLAQISTFVWVGFGVMLLVVVAILWKLMGVKSTGVALIIAGIVTAGGAVFFRSFVANVSGVLVQDNDPVGRFGGSVLSSMLPEILHTWMLVGGGVLIAGIILTLLPVAKSPTSVPPVPTTRTRKKHV